VFQGSLWFNYAQYTVWEGNLLPGILYFVCDVDFSFFSKLDEVSVQHSGVIPFQMGAPNVFSGSKIKSPVFALLWILASKLGYNETAKEAT